MSKISNNNLWNKLVAYCLNNMSNSEELEMDSYLEKNPNAAELADSLLDYCSTNNILDAMQLKEAIDKDHQFYSKFPRSIPQSNTTLLPKRTLWLIAAAILLLLGFFFWQRSTSQEYAPEMAQFWEQEAPRIRAAGPIYELTPWEKAFLDKDYPTTIDLLEKEIAQLPPAQAGRQLFYLTVLYAWQRPPQIELIQQLLPKLKGTVYEEDTTREIEKAGVKLTTE